MKRLVQRELAHRPSTSSTRPARHFATSRFSWHASHAMKMSKAYKRDTIHEMRDSFYTPSNSQGYNQPPPPIWHHPPLRGEELHKEIHRRYPRNTGKTKPRRFTLQEISDINCPYEMAKVIIKEIPRRFVRRLRMIQDLPEGWREVQALDRLYIEYELYLGHLMNQGPVTTEEEMQQFRSLTREVNRLNSVPLMTAGVIILSQREGIDFSKERVDFILNEFFLSRISTELLSLHFLALYDSPDGFVTPQCDPVAVCKTARDVASDLCRFHYGFAPHVHVQYVGDPTQRCFSYIQS